MPGSFFKFTTKFTTKGMIRIIHQIKNRLKLLISSGLHLVGVRGFEPPAPCSRKKNERKTLFYCSPVIAKNTRFTAFLDL